MTYNTIATMAEDPALTRRIKAAAASEGEQLPQEWVFRWGWSVAAQPGWAEAWESAVASGVEPPIGANEGVITDGMILSAVQYVMGLGVTPT